ncbi:MAG: hypothetical protein ACRECH_14010, partial [Nitrososphaerales archaeon]
MVAGILATVAMLGIFLVPFQVNAFSQNLNQDQTNQICSVIKQMPTVSFSLGQASTVFNLQVNPSSLLQFNIVVNDFQFQNGVLSSHSASAIVTNLTSSQKVATFSMRSLSITTRAIRHITTVTIDLRNLKLNLSPALTKLLNIPVQSIELTNFRLS